VKGKKQAEKQRPEAQLKQRSELFRSISQQLYLQVVCEFPFLCSASITPQHSDWMQSRRKIFQGKLVTRPTDENERAMVGRAVLCPPLHSRSSAHEVTRPIRGHLSPAAGR